MQKYLQKLALSNTKTKMKVTTDGHMMIFSCILKTKLS